MGLYRNDNSKIGVSRLSAKVFTAFLISLEKIANKLKIQKLFYTLTGERKK